MLTSNGAFSSMILIMLVSRSGRADVTMTSGGMVSPLSDLPGTFLMMLALLVRPQYIYTFQYDSERNCLHYIKRIHKSALL